MTSLKSLFLISFYNIQKMLEDPFNQNSPDGIRLNDFQFVYQPEPIVVVMPKEKNKEKEKEQSKEIEQSEEEEE